MSEERHGQRGGFFSRMFSPQNEEERTAVYSREEIETEEGDRSPARRRGFTVERAAEIIKDLPSDVPRSSAVRIVRQTLAAAGIDIEELDSSARARESKLNSEIDLGRKRIQELKDDTDEVIRSLQEQIRKAREARDFGISEEERKISAARSGLEDVRLVRDFFDLSGGEPASYESREPSGGEETQVLRRPDIDDTQVLRRPGPLSEEWSEEADSSRGDPGEEGPEDRSS